MFLSAAHDAQNFYLHRSSDQNLFCLDSIRELYCIGSQLFKDFKKKAIVRIPIKHYKWNTTKRFLPRGLFWSLTTVLFGRRFVDVDKASRRMCGARGGGQKDFQIDVIMFATLGGNRPYLYLSIIIQMVFHNTFWKAVDGRISCTTYWARNLNKNGRFSISTTLSLLSWPVVFREKGRMVMAIASGITAVWPLVSWAMASMRPMWRFYANLYDLFWEVQFWAFWCCAHRINGT